MDASVLGDGGQELGGRSQTGPGEAGVRPVGSGVKVQLVVSYEEILKEHVQLQVGGGGGDGALGVQLCIILGWVCPDLLGQ